MQMLTGFIDVADSNGTNFEESANVYSDFYL